MFTIEHYMVQWSSKSWTFRIQPYSGQIYQWKIQSLALDEKEKWLPWLRKKEQNKVKWWYTFNIFLLYGLIKHELHFENWKMIFHWWIWPEYGWILKVHDLLFHCTIECSMVNIGEGNLYVTCIKGFVPT